MLEDLSLFSMAQKTMDWIARRETVLSENVANANTPTYKAKDLKPLDFKDTLAQAGEPLETVTTDPSHIKASVDLPFKPGVEKDRNPQESKPDGNTVVVEDQMEKIGNDKSRYELAANLFQKNLSMLKTALGKTST